MTVSTANMRRIVVTGATGKQGGALINALLQPAESTPVQDANTAPAWEYHIYALTRKPSSLPAQQLLQKHGSQNLTLVEGDLEDPTSITAIFEAAKLESEDGRGIWGVYSAIAFQGLGQSAEPEERQGKLIADISLQYGVETFVYSSSMRAGPKHDDQLHLKPSSKAKANIEQHCMALREKGLKWTILRPSFFMENFDNFIGSIAATIMKKGLKKDTKLPLIASEDIGNVAAAVFRDHERYRYKILTLASEFVTMSEIEDSYKRARGKSIPAVPELFGWALIKMNKATQDLIEDIELNHLARTSGEYPEHIEEVALANSAYKMKTYYEWIKQNKEAPSKNWNQVSLGKLLTGRS